MVDLHGNYFRLAVVLSLLTLPSFSVPDPYLDPRSASKNRKPDADDPDRHQVDANPQH